MKHIIERLQYHNELGIPSEPYFRVYTIKKFLGFIPYRIYSEETCFSWGDHNTSPIDFKTEDDAILFIQNVLCKGIKTEHTKLEIVKTVNCE
jgi:hypothetical protein